MRLITHRAEYKYGDKFVIKPVFDVHWGATACDEKAFREFLADSDEKTLFIFGGDLFDAVIVGDRRYRKSKDKTVSDAIIDENINEMVDILEPYKDKIIGIATGNHEDAIVKHCGTDPVGRLCRELGTKHLGYSGLIRLIMRQKSGGATRTAVIRYHHGWGGGSRTQGADLTKFSKDLAYWQADIFLYGHVHRRQTDSIPRLGITGDKLTSKPKMLCICGTFLKTYTRGIYPTYSEVKGYPPVEIGGCCVSIKPARAWVKLKAWLD